MLALQAGLQKGLALLAALQQVKAMPSGRGNPFPASGPFAPAGRGKRAGKVACYFADALTFAFRSERSKLAELYLEHAANVNVQRPSANSNQVGH